MPTNVRTHDPSKYCMQALSGLTKLRRLSISMSDGMFIGDWPDWSQLQNLENMALRGSQGYMFSWGAPPAWFAKLAKLRSLVIRCGLSHSQPAALWLR